MENESKTLEEIRGTIRVARDSVWEIENEIKKLTDGKPLDQDSKDKIHRNVSHLEWVVSNTDIVNSGEDISDLITAIAAGKAKLS
jgi:hypothetical protein